MDIHAEWKKISPKLEPIAYLLKSAYPDRWVRFHNLPDSKRYPENAAEYQTIIERNKLVLSAILSEEAEITAFVPKYYDDRTVQPSFQEFVKLVETTESYGVVTSALDSDTKLEIHFARFEIGKLPDLLRLVADDVLSNIILAAFSEEIIYHPYDGGMDFIVKDKEAKEALKAKFIEWYPSGTGGF